MTQYLDKAGLQHYTDIVKRRIEQLEGLGRFLSLWDCKTGLPLTEPEDIPYEYKSGDFYIVDEAYPIEQVGPERVLHYYDGTVRYDFDEETFMEKEAPTADMSDYFLYTDVIVNKVYNYGNEKLVVVNTGLLKETIEEVKRQVEAYSVSNGYGTVSTYRYFVLRYFNSGTEWYLTWGAYVDTTGGESGAKTNEHMPCQGNLNYHPPLSEYTENEFKEYIREKVKDWGLKIVGNIFMGDVSVQQTYGLTLLNDLEWTKNGFSMPSGETLDDYGITITTDPVVNDSIEVLYLTEKYNYKPSGTSYDGTASETIEEDEINPNDVYIFDGTVWRIHRGYQKEPVVFKRILGD